MRLAFVAAAALAFAPAAHADAPCITQTFEASRFTVCPADAAEHDVEIAWADAQRMPYRAFHIYAEKNDVTRVRFAMNAGMFHLNGSPVGYLLINKRKLQKLSTKSGPGNFHLKPNGLFFTTATGFGVETTEDFAKRKNAVSATQSGPMLVIDGALHPEFQDDGPSRLRRNGVGVRDAEHAFFVISEGAVSFGKLARFFRDKLECPNALFFDGSVSSLWVPSQNREDRTVPFGPMVVVRDKAKPE
jgi:uncharacterized protein YigE (DUF2233 family)